MGAKKAQMFQPAVDQLIFADDLVKSGVPSSAICYEKKKHLAPTLMFK
jgi:hypothetical protein